VARRGAKSRSKAAPRASQRLGAKLAKDPDEVDLLYAWFDALAAERGEREAESALARRAKASPSHVPALVLGYALFGVGRPGEALRAFELAHQRRPNEQTMYALSGALLADDRIDDAIALLKAADARRPLATRPLVNLANGYAAKGDARKARSALDRISPTGRREWRQLVDSAYARLRWARAPARRRRPR